MWALLLALLCFHGVLGQPQPCALTTPLGGCYLPGLTNAVGTSSKFNSPMGMAFDSTGATMVIADSSSMAVRRVVLATWTVSSVAGPLSGTNAAFADGVGTNVGFNAPIGVAIDPAGKCVGGSCGVDRSIVCAIDPPPPTGIGRVCVREAAARGDADAAVEVTAAAVWVLRRC